MLNNFMGYDEGKRIRVLVGGKKRFGNVMDMLVRNGFRIVWENNSEKLL